MSFDNSSTLSFDTDDNNSVNIKFFSHKNSIRFQHQNLFQKYNQFEKSTLPELTSSSMPLFNLNQNNLIIKKLEQNDKLPRLKSTSQNFLLQAGLSNQK